MYTCGTKYINDQNKKLYDQIILIDGINMYTWETNFINCRNEKFVRTNKLYEPTEQICILVEQILQTQETKFVHTKQIIWTDRTKEK
jgi:Tfp pilus assembly protein PilZ